MNDKDKEAFEKWFKTWNRAEFPSLCMETWQAACEYKQKEIDDKYTEDITYLDEKIKKLQAENAKLRECVEFYRIAVTLRLYP